VEADARKLGCRNWLTLLEEAKAHVGLIMNISEHLGKSQQIKPCRRVPPYRRQLE
jgi:hypothetical protein